MAIEKRWLCNATHDSPSPLISRSQSVREAVVGARAYGLQITGAWPPVPSRRDVKLRASSRPQLSRASPLSPYLSPRRTHTRPSWRVKHDGRPRDAPTPPLVLSRSRLRYLFTDHAASTTLVSRQGQVAGAVLFPLSTSCHAEILTRQDTNLVN